jgi:hypothetical protein
MFDGPDFHFVRPELVDQTLTAFGSGLVHRLTMFAPRGYGKTEFLLSDFAPAAKEAGHEVIYVSLWSDPNSPQQALISVLEESATADTATAWRHARQTSPYESRAPQSVEIDDELTVATAVQRCTSDELQHIASLLNHLGPGDRAGRIVLLLDDIQYLATDAAFKPIIYSLRTALDQLRGNINVFFAGSSKAALSQMFQAQDAPFYESCNWIGLPTLGLDFVDYACDLFTKRTKRVIDRNDAWGAFQRVDCSPARFIRVLTEVASHPEMDIMH